MQFSSSGTFSTDRDGINYHDGGTLLLFYVFSCKEADRVSHLNH